MKAKKALMELEQAARAALEKKASDLVLLGMKGVVSFTDYFLLCTGASAPQVRAISDSVEEQLRRRGLRPAHSEGYEQAEWVLLDYVDFVVHVFSPRARAYYDLERLWRRAARLPVPDDSHPAD
jgi:ribosome-associated protein